MLDFHIITSGTGNSTSVHVVGIISYGRPSGQCTGRTD